MVSEKDKEFDEVTSQYDNLLCLKRRCQSKWEQFGNSFR